jgi:GDP-4-dehydro-6-deoxy-D-mannose reductase
MRALVTGGGGFIGSRLCALLAEEGHDVFSADRRGGSGDASHIHIDLADGASLRSALERAVPDVVFHLAAQTFVPRANCEPLETYETNVLGTARLFEAIAEVSGERPPPRVLHVSSAEVYGPRDPSEYPLREDLAPRPATPYAASKLGSEAVALAATHTRRIPAIIARGFNQIGAGQDPRFAIPSFASQLAEIAAGAQPVMFVGNLESRRDFLDVRDAARAYVALAHAGQPGEIYNVCSGRPVSVKEVLRQLIAVARVPVEVREDPARMRPSDVPLSYGDNAKLRARIDWSPRYPLAETLRSIYADARARLEVSR